MPCRQPPLRRRRGRFRGGHSQCGRFAAVFNPLGHPIPYAALFKIPSWPHFSPPDALVLLFLLSHVRKSKSQPENDIWWAALAHKMAAGGVAPSQRQTEVERHMTSEREGSAKGGVRGFAERNSDGDSQGDATGDARICAVKNLPHSVIYSPMLYCLRNIRKPEIKIQWTATETWVLVSDEVAQEAVAFW
jgi:hypothetical protein